MDARGASDATMATMRAMGVSTGSVVAYPISAPRVGGRASTVPARRPAVRTRAAVESGGAEGTSSMAVEQAVNTTPAYTPSPMDASLMAPQLFALVFILGAAAYLQVFVTGTARARFDKADPERRAFVSDGENDRADGGGEKGWVERELARKGGTRPRGDRTKRGTVIPGVGEAPDWMQKGENGE